MKRFLVLLAVLATHIGAMAHKPSDSYLTMRADGDKAEIAVRWDIALRDLDYVLGLDRDGNGDLTWGEVRTRGDVPMPRTGHWDIAEFLASCND